MDLELDLVLELAVVLLAVLVLVLGQVPRLGTGLEILAWDLLDSLGDFGTLVGRHLKSILVSLTCGCRLPLLYFCICDEVEGKESLSRLSPACVSWVNGRWDKSSVSQWVSILG